MLKNCPECGGATSDQATSCPHCGHPLLAGSQSTPKQRRSPVFTVLAALGLVLCLFTPRLILVLPLFATVACAVIALFRKERARAGAVTVLVLSAALFLFSELGASGAGRTSDPTALSSVKIESWNWRPDSDFGTRGAVVWNVNVRNLTNQYIESVRIELTTYNASGKLITSDFTFIRAIPPGATRSEKGYADYYGTEEGASAQVTDVRFAR